MIGIECKKLRESLNITQKQVADELGYSVKTISAFENGRNNNINILMWYLKRGLEVSHDDNY